MTFEDLRSADKALKVLESLRNQHLFEMSDAVVVTKDMSGYVNVFETEDVKLKGGAVAGGLAGLVVGVLVGGPIGGALLGAATGAIASKIIDIGIPDEKIEQVIEAMDKASSALLVEFKSGDLEKLISAMEETGGRLFELPLSDEAKRQLKEATPDSAGTGSSQTD